MAKIKTIRSIERAVQILGFLQHAAPASLEQVHRGTGLPRATVARVLLTLQNEGMIRRGLADGLYRNSSRLPQLSRDTGPRDRLVSAAAPVMERLCGDIGWPSDLMFRRGIFMEVADSTRSLSPHFVQLVQSSEFVTMPATAVGQVYLAHCPADELSEIAAEMALVDFSLERFYGGRAGFEREMETIRARGYAERHPSQRGQTSLTVANYDDGLMAIAVPLRTEDQVWASLNLLWNRKAGSVRQMVDQYLGPLRTTADDIMMAFAGDDVA